MNNIHSSISSVLVYHIGEEMFATDVKYIVEILEIPRTTKIPLLPHYFRGAINLRGYVLPVLDTRIKLGMPAVADKKDSCIIVLKLGNEGNSLTIGMVVDSVQEMMETHEHDIKAFPVIDRKYKSEFIEGMINHHERFILCLNPMKMFLSSEMNALKTIAQTN